MFLVSHALVRTTLSRYLNLPPEQWTFREGEHGRPEIDPPGDEPHLRFNLSHTLGLVACAVCLDVDCGVDVERLGRVKDMDGVSRRVFTERERVEIGGLADHAKQGRFTDYWSVKEAYIKARGTGFQTAPGTFSVHLGDRATAPCTLEFDSDFDDRAEDWQLAHYPIDTGHEQEFRLAIALRRRNLPSFEIVIREVIPGL